jgi:iron-sulfur cluster assembly protein
MGACPNERRSKLFTVTETAATQLKEIIKGQELAGEVGVRVFVRHQCGCGSVNYGMGFDDSTNEDDEVVTTPAGLKFVVDRGAFGTLEGATIDFVETEMSKGFSISNPNAGAGCGCGGH